MGHCSWGCESTCPSLSACPAARVTLKQRLVGMAGTGGLECMLAAWGAGQAAAQKAGRSTAHLLVPRYAANRLRLVACCPCRCLCGVHRLDFLEPGHIGAVA